MGDVKDPATMTPEELEAANRLPDEGGETGEPSNAEEGKKAEGEEETPEVLRQRLHDTQTALHAQSQRAATIEREKAELQARLEAQGEPKPPEMPDQEDLDEMMTSNPAQYAQIMADKREYEIRKAAWDEKQAQRQKDREETEAQTRINRTADEFVEFAGEVLNVKAAKGEPFTKQPKEIQEFYGSPEFARVKEYVRNHPGMANAEGIVDKATMKMIFRTLNEGWKAPTERAGDRAAEQIENAQTAGSRLTNRGTNDRAPGPKPMKSLNLADIVNMPPQEAETYLGIEEGE
jgi:hypothetical protein